MQFEGRETWLRDGMESQRLARGPVMFPVRFREMEILRMSSRGKSSLADHRARLGRRGLVRVEVSVSKDDAVLVRNVAAALSDPTRQAEARDVLRKRFSDPLEISLKALLASAPLRGIELARDADAGREVDL
jgi:hypothetical protein